MNAKDQTAQSLTDAHFALDMGMVQVFRIRALNENDPDVPVKLLEINDSSPAVGIRPVGFGPDLRRGIAFPVVIVEITSDEFLQLRASRFALPDGWRIAEELTPHAVIAGDA